MARSLAVMRSLVLLLALAVVPENVWAQTRVAVFLVQFPTSPEPRPDTIPATVDVMAQVDAVYAAAPLPTTSDVYGIYTIAQPTGAPYEQRAAIAANTQAAAQAAGVDLSIYGLTEAGGCHCVYISPSANIGAAGWGDLSGAWIASGFTWVTIPGLHHVAHELGHHFGMNQHADVFACSGGGLTGTCQNWNQWDPFDVMGIGNNGFSYVTKEAQGWVPAAQSMDARGDYILNPSTDLGGVRALKFQIGTNKNPSTIYVEYKQPIGPDASQPYAKPDNVFNGVLFYLAPRSGWSGGAQLLTMNQADPSYNSYQFNQPALTVGQTWCESNSNVSITVISVSASEAVIRKGRCK